MKKLLSVLLVVLMLVGMLPMNAIHTHAAEESATLALNVAGNRTSFSTSQQIWKANGITITNNKSSSTSNVADYTPPRFYAKSELIVECSLGNITKIEFLCSSSSYATAMVNSAKGAGATASASGSTATVTLDGSSNTFTISGMTAQVRMGNSVTVYYEAGAASGETYNVSFSVPEGVSSVADMECTGTGITLPTAGVPTGDYTYTFAGWVAQTVDNKTEAPTIYKAGDTFTASEDTTLYALYTYSVAGEGTGSTEYVLTNIANIKATDEVVITMTCGSTVYALPNDGGASTPKAPTVTVSGNQLSGDPAKNLLWNIGGDSSGYILYPAGQTAKWLFHNNSNSGVRIGTTAATYTIDNTGYLKDSNYGRYLGVYLSNPDWRCYTNTTGNTANQTLGFYVKSSGAASTTYYTTEISSTPAECTHENTTTTTVNATCTAAGSTTVTCNDCGETVSTTEIPKLDHSYGEGIVTKPTCTTGGYTTYTCTVCGNSRTDTATEALGHSYESVTSGLTTTYTCTVCGHSYSETATLETKYELVTLDTIAAGNYVIGAVRSGEYPNVYLATDTTSSGDWVVSNTVVAANNDIISGELPSDVQVLVLEGDNTNGFTIGYNNGTQMVYLGYTSYSSRKLAFSASYSNFLWKVVEDTDGGLALRYTNGSDTYTISQNSTGTGAIRGYANSTIYTGIYLFAEAEPDCVHVWGEGVVTAPTCTTDGYTTYTCTVCGHSYTDSVVNALGHSYGEGVVNTAPSCTTAGIKTYTCSACGGTKTETVAATGHTMDKGVVVDPTCETAGSKTYTCTVCGEEQVETIPAINHNWVESERTDATCDTDGKISYICSNDSSHTKTEVITATGHKYDANGVCSVCQKEVSCFQLVTDYTEILAGGEFVIVYKSGTTYYAVSNVVGSKLQPVDITKYITGSGADTMVKYADAVPIWKIDYYKNRNDCFSLYSPVDQKYLIGTDSTSFGSSTTQGAWTFVDKDGVAETDDDGNATGAVAYQVVYDDISDRGIGYNNSQFGNYSVRSGYPMELFFFELVDADATSYTVSFVENGMKTKTESVLVNSNVLEMPESTGAAMPAGYTNFIGWVALPYMESLIAPTTIYKPGDSVAITDDTTFYALYTREDADAEGQSMSYHLVTDNNQLVIGQKYIIVGLYDGQYYAMSKDQLSDDRGASCVVPDANGVITFVPEDNVAVFELNQGCENGSFAFLDLAMNKFLYCANNNNSLKSTGTLDETSSFAITIKSEEGSYGVIRSLTMATTEDTLLFNSASAQNNIYIFSCYDTTSENGQTGIDRDKTFLYVGVPNSTFATYYTTGLCVHDWVLKDSQLASCTQPGYKMYACSICGEIKMEDVKAHGHDVGESDVTVEPTCTTTGLATSTCKNCGETFPETIPALGHTEVVDDAVAASCTATGLTEGKHCSVCGTVLVPQQVAPALGHDFDAAKGKVDNTGDPVVVYPCSRCNETHIAAELKFTNASLTLENNIVVNFKAPANVMGEGEYTGFSDLRAEFTYGNRIGENMIKATSAEIVRQADGKYSVPCRRVTPSQIGDEITATLYGTYDGKEYSFEKKYSAAEYCYAMLKETTDTKLQTLLVNLLYYCDAARAYTTYQGVDKTYKYYGSVTEALTEAQKAYQTVSNEFQSVMGLSGEGEFAATWKSASLILGEATSIRFRVDLGGYDISAVTVKATVGGKDYTDISVKQDGETYLIQIDGISAHRMREKVEVTLCSGETVISKTVRYSIESYVANKMGDTNEKLVNMLIAMMSYGDAAVAYKG